MWLAITLRECQHTRKCIFGGVRKGIRKHLPNLCFDRLFAVQRHGGIHLVSKDPQVIKSKNMVGMRMSEHGSLNESCVFANQLQSQFRSGINDEFSQRSTNQYARTSPVVLRILRTTHRALTTSHRNSDTGAGPHDDHFSDRRFRISHLLNEFRNVGRHFEGMTGRVQVMQQTIYAACGRHGQS